MTNEEITQDILEHCMSGEVIKQSMYVGCMQMAERKDAQFKEYLDKKKAEIEQGIYHSNPLIDGDRWCGRADVINEIINELFNK